MIKRNQRLVQETEGQVFHPYQSVMLFQSIYSWIFHSNATFSPDS